MGYIASNGLMTADESNCVQNPSVLAPVPCTEGILEYFKCKNPPSWAVAGV
jgi:hypothetical protein